MESPINILVTKITGTLVYHGFGTDYIKYSEQNFTLKPFECFLDNEEEHPTTLYYLPNGNLCIHFCIGDEQPSSELMIIQDWNIEHVTRNVPVMEKNNFARIFSYYSRGEDPVPKKLEHLFNPAGHGKD